MLQKLPCIFFKYKTVELFFFFLCLKHKQYVMKENLNHHNIFAE